MYFACKSSSSKTVEQKSNFTTANIGKDQISFILTNDLKLFIIFEPRYFSQTAISVTYLFL